mgnify:CR=1 FL=1|jgi:hypothetical protein
MSGLKVATLLTSEDRENEGENERYEMVVW